MPKHSKEFLKLQKTWYKKLKKSGFEDIETDEDHLKVWSTKWARLQYTAEAPARESYYRLANQFLLEHEFENNLDRVIWEYHSNGISYRNIAKLLRKARIKRVSYTIVWKRVKALRALFMEKHLVKE